MSGAASSQTMICPHCGASGTTPRAVAPGTTVRCRDCARPFKLSSHEMPAYTDMWEENPPPLPAPVPSSATSPSPFNRSSSLLKRSPDDLIGSRWKPFERTRSYVLVFVLTFLAIVVGGAAYWYVNTAKELARGAEAASEARAKAITKQVYRTSPTTAKAAARAKDGVSNDPLRAQVPAALRFGDTLMSVEEVSVDPVIYNGVPTSNRYLKITLKIANRGKDPLSYTGWHAAGKPFEVTNGSGVPYDPIKFSSDALPQGCVARTTIPPKESIRDMMVFEDPKAMMITGLELKFTSPSNLTAQFDIPGRLVKTIGSPEFKTQSTQSTQQSLPQAPSLPPPPPSPEDKIRENAHARWNTIQADASHLASNKRTAYLRSRRQRLIEDLCKENKLSRDELRKIVPTLFGQ